MLQAMERAGHEADDFYTTGRTGRRNALADIMSIHASTSTADMPAKMEALSTNPTPECSEPVASSSGTCRNNITDSTPQQHLPKEVLPTTGKSLQDIKPSSDLPK